jgi:hypothetical protein
MVVMMVVAVRGNRVDDQTEQSQRLHLPAMMLLSAPTKTHKRKGRPSSTDQLMENRGKEI